MGFLIGILTGAVVALLYAPKPGDMTRVELRQRTDELMKRADELERVARDLAGQAQVKGRELADEAKRQWESTAKRSGTNEGGSSTRS
jgi:gas vesicle protein